MIENLDTRFLWIFSIRIDCVIDRRIDAGVDVDAATPEDFRVREEKAEKISQY